MIIRKDVTMLENNFCRGTSNMNLIGDAIGILCNHKLRLDRKKFGMWDFFVIFAVAKGLTNP